MMGLVIGRSLLIFLPVIVALIFGLVKRKKNPRLATGLIIFAIAYILIEGWALYG